MRFFIRESVRELASTNPELYEQTVGKTELFLVGDNGGDLAGTPSIEHDGIKENLIEVEVYFK